MASSTIDKRPNCRYQARYRGPDRRWRSRTFDRKADAQGWLNGQLDRMTRGTW